MELEKIIKPKSNERLRWLALLALGIIILITVMVTAETPSIFIDVNNVSQLINDEGWVDGTDYVPYTGATSNVDLGSKSLETTSTISAGSTNTAVLGGTYYALDTDGEWNANGFGYHDGGSFILGPGGVSFYDGDYWLVETDGSTGGVWWGGLAQDYGDVYIDSTNNGYNFNVGDWFKALGFEQEINVEGNINATENITIGKNIKYNNLKVMDIVNSYLYDNTGSFISADYNNRLLRDDSGVISANWKARELIADDGSTVILNWADDGTADFGDNDIETTETITAGYQVINQTADSQGIQINGYDDKSTSWGKLNIQSDGYYNIDAKTGFSFKVDGTNKLTFNPSAMYVYTYPLFYYDSRHNDNVKAKFGSGSDSAIYWDGADLIIDSQDATANDEIHFTDFDKYTFDDDIETTETITADSFVGDGSGLTNLPAPTTAVEFTDYLNRRNPFLTGQYLLNAEITNVLHNAEKRFDVQTSGFKSVAKSGLFDGNFENLYQIPDGEVANVLINFTNTNGNTENSFAGTVNGLVYPTGSFYIDFYYYFCPEQVNMTFSYKTASDVNTVCTDVVSGNNCIYKCPVAGVYLQTANVSILGDGSYGSYNSSLTEIEYHLTRPVSTQSTFISKYSDDYFYNDLYFRNATNANVIQLDADTGVVSAYSYVDWTPSDKKSSEQAVDVIKNIKSKDGGIDHSSLSDFVKISIPIKEKQCSYKEVGGELIEECEDVIVGEKEGRNLGNQITELINANQDMIRRIEELETKVYNLEHPLGVIK